VKDVFYGKKVMRKFILTVLSVPRGWPLLKRKAMLLYANHELSYVSPLPVKCI
jgi:hypothetical protein